MPISIISRVVLRMNVKDGFDEAYKRPNVFLTFPRFAVTKVPPMQGLDYATLAALTLWKATGHYGNLACRFILKSGQQTFLKNL
jgi:hypothetical protein